MRFPAGVNLPGPSVRSLAIASQVDILPTILDYLSIAATNGYDGQSCFRNATGEVVITAENGDRDPVSFCIQSVRAKAFFQFESLIRPTAVQRTVYLKQVTDTNDAPLSVDWTGYAGREVLKTSFGAAFGSLFPGVQF